MPSGARDGPDPTLIKMWTMARRHISRRTVWPCSRAGTCQHQVFHLWKLSMTKADLSWLVPKTLTYRSFPAGQALPKPCVNSSLFLPSCSGILLPVTTDNWLQWTTEVPSFKCTLRHQHGKTGTGWEITTGKRGWRMGGCHQSSWCVCRCIPVFGRLPLRRPQAISQTWLSSQLFVCLSTSPIFHFASLNL